MNNVKQSPVSQCGYFRPWGYFRPPLIIGKELDIMQNFQYILPLWWSNLTSSHNLIIFKDITSFIWDESGISNIRGGRKYPHNSNTRLWNIAYTTVYTNSVSSHYILTPIHHCYLGKVCMDLHVTSKIVTHICQLFLELVE